MRLKKIVKWNMKDFNEGFVKPFEVESGWGVIFYPFLVLITGFFFCLFYPIWILIVITSWDREVYYEKTSQNRRKEKSDG